jgi:hypothetical protein
MKGPPHVENYSKSPENKAQDTDTPLKTPSKVVKFMSRDIVRERERGR